MLCYNDFMVPQPSPKPSLPTPPTSNTAERKIEDSAQEKQMRRIIIGVIAVVVVLLAALIVGIYFLLRPETPSDEVARIRDVFIIVTGLETLIIGAALVILLIQLASLINLLQNEVRPILEDTSETVRTLRGTAAFLGESVVDPVIKLNGYLASIQRVLELMGIKRK